MEWREATAFPGFAVSECGDVVRTSDGRRIKGSITSDGYVSYSLTDGEGIRRHITAHRLVAFCFLQPPADDTIHVAHGNGSRLLNHYSNLRWVRPVENHADRRSHGTGPSGEKNPKAKLTETDVANIRRIHAMIKMGDIKMRVLDLAKHYGVNPATVCDIVKGRTWAHVAMGVA